MFRQNAVNPLYILVFLNASLANSEDTDKMPHNAAFNRCPLLAKVKNGFQRKKNMLFEIITCDPSMYTRTILSLMYYTRRKSHLYLKVKDIKAKLELVIG